MNNFIGSGNIINNSNQTTNHVVYGGVMNASVRLLVHHASRSAID